MLDELLLLVNEVIKGKEGQVRPFYFGELAASMWYSSPHLHADQPGRNARVMRSVLYAGSKKESGHRDSNSGPSDFYLSFAFASPGP